MKSEANVTAVRTGEAAPANISTAVDRPGREEAEAAVRTLIRWAGDDPDREGLRDTPRRVAASYLEFFSGYEADPVEILRRTFAETDGYDEIVLLRDIRFESHCEHHMAPIIGRAHVAYLPHRRVVGISKLARLVEVYARRLQIQEKMTAQIANDINDILEPEGSRRDHRGGAPVHDHARRAQARRGDDNQPHARGLPRRRRDPARTARHGRQAGGRRLAARLTARRRRRARGLRFRQRPPAVIEFRPILLVVGLLLVTLAVAMCLPAGVDAAHANPDWQVFATAAAITMFTGLALVLSCRTERFRLNLRQAFVMTTLSWLTITLFAALPFIFSNLNLSITDSIFEAMSGITTTGSTVIVGLDTAPPGIHLWRGLLQWLGGLGIIVMAISLMPMLGVGGMQMFRAEAFETGEKTLPRAAQISAALSLIYAALTVIWTLLLYAAGMTWLEAVVHAMTTIATGGFSTRDASIGGFANPAIDLIIFVGMLTGSLPFMLYLRTLQGERTVLLRDSQVRWFFAIVAVAAAVATVFIWFGIGLTLPESLRYGAFNVVSVMTGTGYVTSDFWQWGAFAGPMFFFIMFIGGCTGSTTCGIKIFRFQVLYAAAQQSVPPSLPAARGVRSVL